MMIFQAESSFTIVRQLCLTVAKIYLREGRRNENTKKNIKCIGAIQPVLPCWLVDLLGLFGFTHSILATENPT